MVADLLPEEGSDEEDNPTNRPFGLRLRGICPSRVGSSWYFRPSDFIRASRAGSIVFSLFRLMSPTSVQFRAPQLRISDYNNASSGVAPTMASQCGIAPLENTQPEVVSAPEITPQMEISEIGSSCDILPINDHSSETSEIPR